MPLTGAYNTGRRGSSKRLNQPKQGAGGPQVIRWYSRTKVHAVQFKGDHNGYKPVRTKGAWFLLS
jgi:hypothetical protein